MSNFWLHIRGKVIILCQNFYIMKYKALRPTNINIYSPNKIIHGHSFYMNTYLLLLNILKHLHWLWKGEQCLHEKSSFSYYKTIIFRENCGLRSKISHNRSVSQSLSLSLGQRTLFSFWDIFEILLYACFHVWDVLEILL